MLYDITQDPYKDVSIYDLVTVTTANDIEVDYSNTNKDNKNTTTD